MKSEIFDLIKKEEERQSHTIELIASENFVSNGVKAALGSCLTNKYAEGYPTDRYSGRRGRYYGGCQYIDQIEEKCCDLWRQVFHTNYHVNVQPHSGSSANLAAYMSVLKPGGTVLAMALENGGHLTHGSIANFSGKLFNMVFYGLNEKDEIDFDDVAKKIDEYHPQLILAGASAYSKEIPFHTFAEIIYSKKTETYKPYFMVDMAHVAGLVAAGLHDSPFGYADIITTTTHKTLRGPRGGMIFCRPELANTVDGAVFPGTQGGPLEHVIAAKAIAAEECLDPSFKEYIKAVVENCKAFADEFMSLGYHVVGSGTDNHLFLIDLSETHPHVSGRDVQEALDELGITLNKNCVPGDKRRVTETSGIRLGTAAMTTKGFTSQDFRTLAHTIATVINYLELKNTAKEYLAK